MADPYAPGTRSWTSDKTTITPASGPYTTTSTPRITSAPHTGTSIPSTGSWTTYPGWTPDDDDDRFEVLGFEVLGHPDQPDNEVWLPIKVVVDGEIVHMWLKVEVDEESLEVEINLDHDETFATASDEGRREMIEQEVLQRLRVEPADEEPKTSKTHSPDPDEVSLTAGAYTTSTKFGPKSSISIFGVDGRLVTEGTITDISVEYDEPEEISAFGTSITLSVSPPKITVNGFASRIPR